MPTLEVLALVLALPGALEAICCLLARAHRRPRTAGSRMSELEIALRLQIRRSHRL